MAMPEERRAKLLSLVDVLEPLSEGELRDLARRCPDVAVGDGEDFYSPATHDGGLFLILEGRVRLHLTTPRARRPPSTCWAAARCCGPAGWNPRTVRPCTPGP
jgi:hypothetical protein